MSTISERIRKGFGESDRRRDAGLTTPDDVVRFDDIQYGEDPEFQVLDVYRPKGVEGNLPVIMIVHGGGWVYGDKGVYQFYAMSLAQRGFAIVNYSYRLAPEYRYPAAVEDTNSVVKWTLANGDKYGFDCNNIFAVGDSAGGQILSVYSAILTNSRFSRKYKLDLPEKFCFRAIGLNCGRYADSSNEPESLSNSLMGEVVPSDWKVKDLKKMNCVGNVTRKFPPSFVMTSYGDFLKDQPERLIVDLKAHQVPFTYRMYGSAKNRLPHVFHCNIKTEDARICNDEECAFFRKFIK